MFSLSIFGGEPRYIRRTRAYLQEARMSVLEHRIAAEHYQASADMYAERARRLEEEFALWEAQKNGAQVLEAVAESQPATPSVVDSGRIESAKPARHKAAPTVGIVRAA
ncbi:MAG: hypothetical protein ACN6NT_03530 [Comamonas sp.]